MNTQAIELTEIKHDLANLPPDKLQEVHDFVRRLSPRSHKNIQPLEGIWEGLGWEKVDIEEEVRKLRQESSEQILKKFDNWNS